MRSQATQARRLLCETRGVGIWYPADAPTLPQSLGNLPQTAAANARVRGDHLGLVVISHGSGGWFGDFVDIAQALAKAGFVVVAPTHAGDNFRDQSENGWRSMVDRPQQIHRIIDFMLQSWTQRTAIDAARIGFFGFSAGGTTGLIAIGGTPDVMDPARGGKVSGVIACEPMDNRLVAHWL